MAILVVSPQNSYAIKRLRQEAKAGNVELSVMDVKSLAALKFKLNIASYSALYVRNPYLNGGAEFLPQVVELAKKFKAAGKRVVDSNISSGNLGKGKWLDYVQLKKAGLAIPKTQILSQKSIPKAWPFILKWIYGFKSRNVFLINNQAKFNEIFGQYLPGELLVQEFVRAEFEYKVICVGYKALPVVLKFAIHPLTQRPDFERFEIVTSTQCKKLIMLAQKASKILGRELCKVDVLQSKGSLYILEVNRFPGLDSFEGLTKYNVFGEFLAYLQK